MNTTFARIALALAATVAMGSAFAQDAQLSEEMAVTDAFIAACASTHPRAAEAGRKQQAQLAKQQKIDMDKLQDSSTYKRVYAQELARVKGLTGKAKDEVCDSLQ